MLSHEIIMEIFLVYDRVTREGQTETYNGGLQITPAQQQLYEF